MAHITLWCEPFHSKLPIFIGISSFPPNLAIFDYCKCLKCRPNIFHYLEILTDPIIKVHIIRIEEDFMKWIIFACFVVISFTALAADVEKKRISPKKLNFRTLASVSSTVEKDVAFRVQENMLREEEERILNSKEEWLKTLEYMEANSFQDQK